MRTLFACSLALSLAVPAFAQNPPPALPKFDLDPANDPAIRRELENVHKELSNLLKQQTDYVKAVTPNAASLPQNCFNTPQPSNRLYGSGRTGLALVPLPADLRLGLKVDPDVGVLVRAVFPETPAALAGYLPGDVLVEFNGDKVPANLAAFMESAARLKSDTPITGVVLRDGKRLELNPMKVTDRRVVPGHVETVGVPSAANVIVTPAIRNVNVPTVPIQRFDGIKDVTFANK